MNEPRHVSRWMILGFGVILLLLVSLPLVAIVTGALNGSPQYTLMQDVPKGGDGAYVQVNDGTRQGVVQLYPWNFELDTFPADAPVFNPSHITAFVVSQEGIDDATRYHLFRLDDDSTVPWDGVTKPTEIIFSLQAPLTDGQYEIDIPKSGLSSDRQDFYFKVSGKAATLPVK